MNSESHNPYQPPKQVVRDIKQDEDYADVKLFSFAGRMGRMRYLVYMALATVLFYFILIVALVILQLSIAANSTNFIINSGLATPGELTAIYFVLSSIIPLMFGWQRAHDFNLSGWFGLVSLIPVVNLMFVLIPGTRGQNRFGYQPKPNPLAIQILFWLIVSVSTLFLVGIIAAVVTG